MNNLDDLRVPYKYTSKTDYQNFIHKYMNLTNSPKGLNVRNGKIFRY